MYIDLIQYILYSVKIKGLIILFDLMQEQWLKNNNNNCKKK